MDQSEIFTKSVFYTDDTQLALVLASLGVPYADPLNPAWAFYTPKMLKLTGQECTIAQAQAAGIKPRLKYYFADHPKRAAIVEAFGKGKSTGAGSRNEMAHLAEEDLAFWGALLLQNRKELFEQQKKCPPKLYMENTGQTSVNPNEGTASYQGSITVLGEQAPESALKHLGVQ